MAIKYEATLKHGGTYTYAGQKFERNIPGKRLLTKSQKDYLERHAKHVVKTTTGDRHEVCAFDFRSREVEPAPPVRVDDETSNVNEGTDAGGSEAEGNEGAGADDGAGEGDQGGGEGDEGDGVETSQASAAPAVPPGVRPSRRRGAAAQ
jgi:hypothetical protein